MNCATSDSILTDPPHNVSGFKPLIIWDLLRIQFERGIQVWIVRITHDFADHRIEPSSLEVINGLIYNRNLPRDPKQTPD